MATVSAIRDMPVMAIIALTWTNVDGSIMIFYDMILVVCCIFAKTLGVHTSAPSSKSNPGRGAQNENLSSFAKF